MHEGYGDPRIKAHQRHEAIDKELRERQEAEALYKGILRIVAWVEVSLTPIICLTNTNAKKQADKPPVFINVTPKTPGLFRPEDYKVLCKIFENNFFLYVYDPQRSASNDPWSLQEFDVFIPILPHTRVLLRADSVPHHKCPGLDEQVSGLLQEVLSVSSHLDGPVSSAVASTSAISTPSGLQPIIPPPPISERHLTASSSVMLQAHAIGTSAPRKIAAVPFPLRYTCDMIEGLARLASNLSDAKAIDDSGKGKITRKEQAEINRRRTSDAFAVNFKGSKYVRSTFNKALRVYKKALHLDGIIDKYTAYGRSPTGYWSAFEAQVNRQSPSVDYLFL